MTQQNKQYNYGDDISTAMVNKINTLNQGLQEYKIRELVEDTEKLGKELVRKQLKTNQIRKFLDAVNRLKSILAKDEKKDFSKIEPDLVFLQPKLAYAAARQQKDSRDPGPVAPFKRVLEAAIKKVKTKEDFDRFVQMIEAVIAYHKAAGGKDQ
ncbi:MAG: type III-A CRISPR-associated protein Csm2 [Brasilonema angustatum HA4187-MV1]|jgi:CRISPR-associated protein Csm2|nr:type III-A CRISPR-associated protein Csm2 [Brasilonema angustatum HA4187-MV1]